MVPDYAKAQALLDEIAQLSPASEPAAPDAKSKKKPAASKEVPAEAVPSDASATKCAAVSQWARPGTTGEFHGDCGEAPKGIVLWKMKGKAVEISCKHTREGVFPPLP